MAPCVISTTNTPMTKIVVGGVPEHFLSPFHIGLDRGIFVKHGIDLEFIQCPGGTGEMVSMLQYGELDIAIALTEGLITAIARGSKEFRIVDTYTDSSLTWAVSVGATSIYQSMNDIEGGNIGISRYCSGSHIMAILLAKQQGWIKPPSFTVQTNFRGLRDGVNTGTTDAFLWEHFTTKPFHDVCEVRRVGDITAPWPAFLVAGRVELLDSSPAVIRAFRTALHESCHAFLDDTDFTTQYVAKNYGNTAADAAAWLSTLRYSEDGVVLRSAMNSCVKALVEAGILEESGQTTVESLTHSLTRLEN